MRACTIRGNCLSAPNLPSPRSSRPSSLRGALRPTCLLLTWLLVGVAGIVLLFSGLGDFTDGLDDALIAGAPAQVRGHHLADLLGIGFGRIGQIGLRQHQEPRRAEPALQAMVLTERLLEVTELVAVGEAFHGTKIAAVSLHTEY